MIIKVNVASRVSGYIIESRLSGTRIRQNDFKKGLFQIKSKIDTNQ